MWPTVSLKELSWLIRDAPQHCAGLSSPIGLSAWPLALHPAGLVRQEQAQGVGWELSDPTHHCYWQRITCDSDGKVMQM